MTTFMPDPNDQWGTLVWCHVTLSEIQYDLAKWQQSIDKMRKLVNNATLSNAP